MSSAKGAGNQLSTSGDSDFQADQNSVSDIIRQRIKAAIEAAGLSYTDIVEAAKKIDQSGEATIDRGHLSRYLNGKREMSLDRVELLAKITGVGVDSIVGNNGTQPTMRRIPLLPIRRLPMHLAAAALAAEVKRISREDVIALVSDPLAFALRLEDPFEDLKANDVIVVTQSPEGRDGDLVVVNHGNEPHLARLSVVKGTNCAQIRGKTHANIKVVGRIAVSIRFHD